MFLKKYNFSSVLSLFIILLLGFFAISCQTQQEPAKPPVTPPDQPTGPSNSSPTLDQKIGQMIMVGFRGLYAPAGSQIAKDIKNDHIGGVVIYSYDVPTHSSPRNIQSPKQLKKLTSQLQSYTKTPLFIAIDQEGGEVARLTPKYGFKPTVSAQYLGTLNNLDTTRFYAKQMADELHNEGINVDFAPVVGLNVNPDNPSIGALHRSFSADPEIVVRNAQVFINEFHKKGIIATLKHFPGLGSASKNTHKGFVNVTKTWSKKALIPFKKIIDSGYNGMIMVTHIFNAHIDSVYPATLSKPAVTGLLRDSLGFNGVVITDDLQMGAIRKYYSTKEAVKQAILAGEDILLFSNNSIFDPQIADKVHHIIKNLVENGTISKKRINQSYKRIMKLKGSLSKK